MKKIAGLLLFVTLFTSCKVFFPDRMFRIDEERLASADTVKTPPQYFIRPGDVLSLGVFSNNGYELVDVLSRENTSYSPLRYLVKPNGYAQLPMLDSVLLAGMTVAEAERMLVSRYAYYFVSPFVTLDVTNRDVYVFRGREGAEVITLTRDDMNLLEVIAASDGMPRYGKAYRVRVIRGNLNHPTVFDIDLSTIEGMQQANLVMVANDVVYIETRVNSSDVLAQITPVLTFLTTVLLLYTTIYALAQ